MQQQTVRTLNYPEYVDRVLGAWVGKSLGGIVGAPFEGHKILGHKSADTIWPDRIYPNDDLDIQVVWLELMEERGCHFTRQDMIELWQDRCWYNFAEYGTFLNNVQRGINPPASGWFNNEFFSQSMGCPIRAEIWGLVAPGNPALASALARMDGELDHEKNSVWAEQFWAAAVAAAFFANSLAEVLEAGRRVIPKHSDDYEISQLVPALYAANPKVDEVWLDLVRRYGHRDGSKGLINFAFTLLALCAGGGDFKETIRLTVNFGWDADCTAATAGALLGALYGDSCMPMDWKEKMGAHLTCDIAVRHKTALLTAFAEDTCKVGMEMTLHRNRLVKIKGAPEGVATAVARRAKGRKPLPECTLTSSYPVDPVLLTEGGKATLHIHYSGNKTVRGKLAITSPDGLIVSPANANVTLTPGSDQTLSVDVRPAPNGTTLWDKNVMEAALTVGKACPIKHRFGLAGARLWRAYGPYWDIYDTTTLRECPFRNDKVIANPHTVGYGEAGCHFFARLDKPYLDEAKLFKQDLPGERPLQVEAGPDWLDSADLGGFRGESVYYLAREIVADKPIECRLCVGCTVPFVLYVDGQEVMRKERYAAWYHVDHECRIRYTRKPTRIVAKLMRATDDFRFSICHLKMDVVGKKTIGHSYLIDTLGDVR